VQSADAAPPSLLHRPAIDSMEQDASGADGPQAIQQLHQTRGRAAADSIRLGLLTSDASARAPPLYAITESAYSSCTHTSPLACPLLEHHGSDAQAGADWKATGPCGRRPGSQQGKSSGADGMASQLQSCPQAVGEANGATGAPYQPNKAPPHCSSLLECEGAYRAPSFMGSEAPCSEVLTSTSSSSNEDDMTGAGLHAVVTCLSLLAAAPNSDKGQWLRGLVRHCHPLGCHAACALPTAACFSHSSLMYLSEAACSTYAEQSA
jgi:hypothetical protein